MLLCNGTYVLILNIFIQYFTLNVSTCQNYQQDHRREKTEGCKRFNLLKRTMQVAASVFPNSFSWIQCSRLAQARLPEACNFCDGPVTF